MDKDSDDNTALVTEMVKVNVSPLSPRDQQSTNKLEPGSVLTSHNSSSPCSSSSSYTSSSSSCNSPLLNNVHDIPAESIMPLSPSDGADDTLRSTSPDKSSSTITSGNLTENDIDPVITSTTTAVHNLSKRQERKVRLTKRTVTTRVLARPRINTMDPDEMRQCFETGNYDVIESNEPQVITSEEVSTYRDTDKNVELSDLVSAAYLRECASMPFLPREHLHSISSDDKDLAPLDTETTSEDDITILGKKEVDVVKEVPVTISANDSPTQEAGEILPENRALEEIASSEGNCLEYVEVPTKFLPEGISVEENKDDDSSVTCDSVKDQQEFARENQETHEIIQDDSSFKEYNIASPDINKTGMKPPVIMAEDPSNSPVVTLVACGIPSITEQFNQIAKGNKSGSTSNSGTIRIRKTKETVYSRYKTQPVSLSRYSTTGVGTSPSETGTGSSPPDSQSLHGSKGALDNLGNTSPSGVTGFLHTSSVGDSALVSPSGSSILEGRRSVRLSPSPKPTEDLLMLRKIPYSSLDRRFRYLRGTAPLTTAGGVPINAVETSQEETADVAVCTDDKGGTSTSSSSNATTASRARTTSGGTGYSSSPDTSVKGAPVVHMPSSSYHTHHHHHHHSRFHSDELVAVSPEGYGNVVLPPRTTSSEKHRYAVAGHHQTAPTRRITEKLRRQSSDEGRDSIASASIASFAATAPGNDNITDSNADGDTDSSDVHRISVCRSHSAASSLPSHGQRTSVSQSMSAVNDDVDSQNRGVKTVVATKTLPSTENVIVQSVSHEVAMPPPMMNAPVSEDVSRMLVKRNHIINELLDVESEYVKTLDLLVNVFKVQLKHEEILDDNQVDTIFYKVHEILMYHANFLAQLNSWMVTNTIGEKISNMFRKPAVIDCYTSFIANFSLSEKMLEHCLTTKTSFVKFVETKQRETRNKLPLKALIVQPIQRIPRYELLIKRLIEYTPSEFPDYNLLLEAEKTVHELALRINAVKESSQDESLTEGLKLLERLQVPGTTSSSRQYIRHDLVQLDDRKEPVCIFMFSDQLICTIMKRRPTQANKKPGYLRLPCPSGLDIVDNVKYKVFHRINMENIENDSESLDTTIFSMRQRLKHDLSLLEQMKQYAVQLNKNHNDLEEEIQRLTRQIETEYEDIPKQGYSKKTTFTATTKDGIERHTITFISAEKRANWERALTEMRNQLVTIPRTPQYYQTLQITRTRSGMQFSCAAPIEGYNSKNQRDVWICQSDGCSGQICLLSMQPDPIVTLNTPLTSCNSQITCICAVPGWTGKGALSRTNSGKRRSVIDEIPHEKTSHPNMLSAHSPSSQTDTSLKQSPPVFPEVPSDIIVTVPSADPRISPNQFPFNRNNPNQPVFNFTSSESESDTESNAASVEAFDEKVSSSTATGSVQILPDRKSDLNLDSLDESSSIVFTSSKKRRLTDPYKATMWLGSEEGLIFIFYSSDNIKTTRNKQRIQMNSSVQQILFHDAHVYVSLGNGELLMYKRDADGLWDVDNPNYIDLNNQKVILRRLLAVTGSIWAACKSNIIVYNPKLHRAERMFSVGNSSYNDRSIQLMSCAGHGVWIALESSASIFLHHATTYELLCEVDVRSAVSLRLQGCDDIITRHKEACLRLTCLLVCKDILMAGTSAGVVVTIATPKISSTTTRGMIKPPRPDTLEKGHTGHVRFLVSLESPSVLQSMANSLLSASSKLPTPNTSSSTPSSGSSNQSSANTNPAFNLMSHHHHTSRRASLSPFTTMATQMRVICGGDGYEDFDQQRSGVSNLAELADLGKDDSVNHLLVWDIP